MIPARVVKRVVSDRSTPDRFDQPCRLKIANKILTVRGFLILQAWTKRGKSVVQLPAILRPSIDVKGASGLIVRIGERRRAFACSYVYVRTCKDLAAVH